MDEFKVATGRLSEEAGDLKLYADDIKQAQADVREIHNGIRYKLSSMSGVGTALKKLENDIWEEALSMSTLSGALNAIANYYRSSEMKIASYGIDGAVIESPDGSSEEFNQDGITDQLNAAFNSFIEGIRSMLLSWGIIKAQKQEHVEGEVVKEIQQKEMDLYMQNEIQKVLKEARFSKKSWEKASTEERKAILNEYLQRIAGIMGLPVGEINYTYTEAKNGYYNMGSYARQTNTININEWVIETKTDSYDLMSTIAHEMRHAYQYAACENPDKFAVTAETIQEWQDSFDTYRGQSTFKEEFGMNEADAFEAYRNQAVEKDARNFAKQG